MVIASVKKIPVFLSVIYAFVNTLYFRVYDAKKKRDFFKIGSDHICQSPECKFWFWLK